MSSPTMRNILGELNGKDFNTPESLFGAVSKVRVKYVSDLEAGTTVSDLLYYANNRGWLSFDKERHIASMRVPEAVGAKTADVFRK